MSQIIPTDRHFSEFNSFVQNLKPSKVFFLVDENTHEHCLPTLLGNFETEMPFEIIEIESGEEMKTLETAHQLYEILAEFEADRNALLINLGGGVITDLGGFLASTYKRGINFINFPTTLLAMCDASIGGKTGVNLNSLKNIVGTFANPEATFIYPDFIKTLPEIQVLSGFAEMLKHGLIADEAHFTQLSSLENLRAEKITPYIYASAKIKNDIVKLDPLEKNQRKNLNFGHTAGHALESLAMQKGAPIPHGFAVATGMFIENLIAGNLNILNKKDLETANKAILKFFGRMDFFDETDFPTLLSLMKNDKKNKNGEVKMVLIPKIGSCKYDISVKSEETLSAFTEYLSEKC